VSGGGPPCAQAVGRLHSRYRPEAEAERYLEAINPARDADFFILVEPGMGYLVDALRKLRPGAGTVALHADPRFREFENLRPYVPSWYPDCGKTVQEFLEAEIPEGASARIVEWRPSLSVYGQACLRLVRESADFIKRAEAGRRTVAAFGRRWLRNFFRNLGLVRVSLLCSSPMDVPVVVTGSGPGLEAALPEIRAARDGVFVLASSSSLPALAAGGIAPDMAIGTDGGGWALMHLYACFRAGATPGLKLACALTAALPSRCSELPVLPIRDGGFWQTAALAAAGLPSVSVPQRGTVTASAMELALSLSSGLVFLAGADLCVADVRTHARPYGFDHLFFGAASRLRPVYAQAFARFLDVRAGGSHDIYAAWFKTRLESLGGRVFSLGAGRGVFENAPSLGPFVGRGKSGAGEGFRELRPEGRRDARAKLALGALVAGLNDPRSSPALAAELGPLLFPGRREVRAAELAETLPDVAGLRQRG